MRADRRGLALILVLLCVAGLFALASQAAVVLRSAVVESRLAAERSQALRDARGGAMLVLMGLLDDGRRQGDDIVTGLEPGGPGSETGSEVQGDGTPRTAVELPPIIREMLGERAREVEEQARERRASGARGRGLGGRQAGGAGAVRDLALPPEVVELRLREGGPMVRISLLDASGGVNVNTADEERLRRYFIAVGIDALEAAALADQILDWRDEDDFVRPLGMEAPGHSQRGVACRNGRVRALEELLLLPAVTPALFERVRGGLCVDGDGKAHAGTAPRAVLASLPAMDGETADRMIAARRAGPFTEESLSRALGVASAAAREFMRLEPTSVVSVRVEVMGERRDVFEGMAVLGGGRVRALGLRRM